MPVPRDAMDLSGRVARISLMEGVSIHLAAHEYTGEVEGLLGGVDDDDLWIVGREGLGSPVSRRG